MNFFKCQICGGELEIVEKSPIGTCSCCGSKQTLPNANEEEVVATEDGALKGIADKVTGKFSKFKEKRAAKKAAKEERKLAKLEAKGKAPKAKKDKKSNKKKAIIITSIIAAVVIIAVVVVVVLMGGSGSNAGAIAPGTSTGIGF